MKVRTSFAAVLVGLTIALGVSSSADALSLFGFRMDSGTTSDTAFTPQQTNSTLNACLHYTNHVFEVCTAYIANSSIGALWPYYAYAHSNDPLIADAAAFHFGSRYTGQAYNLITNRVAGWPSGDTDASMPDIQILSVSSSLATNTATLHTVESWRVTTPSGQVLFGEDNMPHTIVMHRVPSYILHKWVVSNIY